MPPQMLKEIPDCPVALTARMIGNKWKILILRDLLEEARRFSELKKSLPSITQKVLTANLREMEEACLLTRTVYPEVPPRVEYALTEIGESLRPVIDRMYVWGQNYKMKHADAPPGPDDPDCGTGGADAP